MEYYVLKVEEGCGQGWSGVENRSRPQVILRARSRRGLRVGIRKWNWSEIDPPAGNRTIPNIIKFVVRSAGEMLEWG